MKVIEFKSLEKKDSPLHYRNEYNGSIILETADEAKIEKRISFILERSALGSVDISVQLQEDIDYPLIPVIRSIKDYVKEMDKEGKLP